LAAGEAGYFGNKGKFYETDLDVPNIQVDKKFDPPNPAIKNNPSEQANAIPFVRPNPFVQRGNPQRATLPYIRGPRAQTPQLRGPFMAQAFTNSTSIPALVLMVLFVGSGIVFAFRRVHGVTSITTM